MLEIKTLTATCNNAHQRHRLFTYTPINAESIPKLQEVSLGSQVIVPYSNPNTDALLIIICPRLHKHLRHDRSD